MQVCFSVVKRCTRYLIYSFCHSLIAEDKKTFGTTHIFWWVVNVLINDWSRTEKGDGCVVVSELMTLVNMYTRTFSWVSRMYRVSRQKMALYTMPYLKSHYIMFCTCVFLDKFWFFIIFIYLYRTVIHIYTLNQNLFNVRIVTLHFQFPRKNTRTDFEFVSCRIPVTTVLFLLCFYACSLTFANLLTFYLFLSLQSKLGTVSY